MSRRRRPRRTIVVLKGAVLVAGAGSSAVGTDAAAEPQLSAAATFGGGVAELRSDRPHAALQLGIRGDALFLRSRDSDMGVGPYVDFVSTGLETVELGGGAEWLIPLSTTLPVVLSGGLSERRGPSPDWGPAVVGTVFLGSRSYNFDSLYSLSGGGFVQGRYGVAGSQQADLIVGAQIDLALVALPFLLVVRALR